MKLRKNAGSKKREKSLEISRFLAVWLAKRLFPSLGSELTCQYGRGCRVFACGENSTACGGGMRTDAFAPGANARQNGGATPASRKATSEGGFSVVM